MGRNRSEQDERRVWAERLPLLLVVAGVLVYLNSFSGVFLLDDARNIVERQYLRRLWPIWGVLAHSNRPVVDLSFAVNYAISGLEVWGYHAYNVTVHVFAGLALFGIVRRTLSSERLRQHHHRSAPWLAFAVALVWLVHPLQTQSVTYVVQRAESTMGLFYFVTLYCVIRGMASPRSRWWYAAAVASCALGMGSKAVMVTAPLVVGLYDRVYLSRSVGEMLRRRWGLYLGLAATWGVLGASGIVRHVFFPPETFAGTVGFSFREVTWRQYALSQSGVMLHYLRLAYWPSALCLDYWWPAARALSQVWPQALALGALLVATLWALWREPRWGFAGAWVFLILAPTSSFIPIRDLAFEHRMYLPLAGVVSVTLIGGHRLFRRVFDRASLATGLQRLILTGLTGTIVVLLGHRTIQRNRDYHSAVRMWTDVVGKRPHNARAHDNLATALVTRGEVDKAIEHYREALRIKPGWTPVLNNYAKALLARGKTTEAIRRFRQALKAEPSSPEIRNNLGHALAVAGRLDEAIGHFHQVLQERPTYAMAHSNLGNALAAQSRSDQAIEHYRRALEIDPDFADAHNNLGAALRSQGKLEEAIGHYRRALQIRPAYAQAHNNLGLALAMTGRLDEALRRFREAARLKPEWPAPLARAAWILATRPQARARDGREAVRLARRASELTGNQNARYLDTLAASYAAAEQFEHAVMTAQAAISAASHAQDHDLATRIRKRLELYRKREPYREPAVDRSLELSADSV